MNDADWHAVGVAFAVVITFVVLIFVSGPVGLLFGFAVVLVVGAVRSQSKQQQRRQEALEERVEQLEAELEKSETDDGEQ
ncbi:hypothetical protein [Halapricum hydrolyticum]|uniref:Uncharacterized protein n=1 Tax=Halapricum hydrolyticum TaxID=2979991 RepID=A0AAE3IEH1_9EURY|nr:hypothetical protein [Halapricum hydrolyticum]MCU4719326.1 hypothetical protein [Halapricum hydrolyticum]MCU4728229.1 hypothetical protein [Halapricum hydrolyticum]